jgi:hypothetical protein
MPSVGFELTALVFVSRKTAFRTLSLCQLQYAYIIGKGKVIPLQVRCGPEGG